MSNQIDSIISQMEKYGPDQVKLLIQSGHLPQGWEVHAVEWLARKDQEEKRVGAAALAEQT
jgi:hypothetical protein